jgi:oligosaccharide repeat unit polymerase
VTLSIAGPALLLALLLVLPTLLELARTREFDIVSPMAVFTAFMALAYLSPIFSFMEGTDQYTLLWPCRYADFEGSLSGALWLAVLATVAFQAAYYWSSAWPVAPEVPDEEWSASGLRTVGVAYTAAGLAFFAVGVSLVGGFAFYFERLGDRIRLFEGLNYFFLSINLTLVVAALWAYRNLAQGGRPGLAFWCYTIAAFVAVGLQGNRSTNFVFVAWLAVVYRHTTRRIPVLKALAGVAVLFAWFIFYVLVAREYLAVGHFVTFDSSDLSTVVPVIQREFGELQVLTVIVDRVPDALPYQWGSTYLALLASPVPGKPLPSTATLTLAVWPERWLRSGTTMPPGLIGEFYMNFGVLGVAVGMAALGALLARGYRRALASRNAASPILHHALFLATVPHFLRGDSYGPAILLATLALPLVAALRFLDRRSQSAPMAAPRREASC